MAFPPSTRVTSRHGKWMARQTIRALERCDAEYIVSGSASCVATLSQDYLHLFRDDPAWLARAESIARKVIDFTSFIDSVAESAGGQPRAREAARGRLPRFLPGSERARSQ